MICYFYLTKNKNFWYNLKKTKKENNMNLKRKKEFADIFLSYLDENDFSLLKIFQNESLEKKPNSLEDLVISKNENNIVMKINEELVERFLEKGFTEEEIKESLEEILINIANFSSEVLDEENGN